MCCPIHMLFTHDQMPQLSFWKAQMQEMLSHVQIWVLLLARNMLLLSAHFTNL